MRTRSILAIGNVHTKKFNFRFSNYAFLFGEHDTIFINNVMELLEKKDVGGLIWREQENVINVDEC